MKGKDIREILAAIAIIAVIGSLLSVFILLVTGEFDSELVRGMLLKIAILLFTNAIVLCFLNGSISTS